MAIYRFQITRKIEQYMDVAINASSKEEAEKMIGKIVENGACPNVNMTKTDILDEMNKRLGKFNYPDNLELRDPDYTSYDSEDEYVHDCASSYVGTRSEEFRLTYTPPVEDKFDVQVVIEDDPKELPTPAAFNNLEGVKTYARATTKAYLELFGLNTQTYVKLKNFFLNDCEGHKTLFNRELAEGRHDIKNRPRAFVVNSTKLGEASMRELAKRAQDNVEPTLQAGIPTPIPNQIKEQILNALMGRPRVGVHIVDLRDIRG